jgi:hypothetical protein
VTLPPRFEEWRVRLGAARAALLAVLEGIDQETLVRRPPGEPSDEDERWPIRDVLWHVGEQEERWQRWARLALKGRNLESFARGRRPAAVNTLPALLTWLEQRRSSTHVLLEEFGRLEERELTREREQPPGWRAPLSLEDMLGLLERHDRAHTKQVAELLGREAPGRASEGPV